MEPSKRYFISYYYSILFQTIVEFAEKKYYFIIILLLSNYKLSNKLDHSLNYLLN